MFQRLALQRRRLFAATLLSYLGGLIFVAAAQGTAGSAPVLTLAACTALGALVLSSIVVLVWPALRSLCEAVAGGGLVAAILAHHDVLNAQNPWAMLAGLTLGTALLHALMHSPLWARTPLRFDWTTRRRFSAPCPASAAWSRLVPDPASPAAHYSGVFLGQRAVPGHPDRLIQITRGPDGAPVETLHILRAVSPPHHIHYSYSSCAPEAEFAAGDFSLTIWPRGQSCDVAIAETVHALHVGTAFDLWFDDLGGQMRAAMQSALTHHADRNQTARNALHPPERVA